MKINFVDLSNLKDLPNVLRFLSPFCKNVSNALQNGLSFQDNIRSSIVPVKFSTTANQNIQILHGLNAQPIGYIPIQTSAACSIYNGNSLVMNATFINLKCSVAGITATILVF